MIAISGSLIFKAIDFGFGLVIRALDWNDTRKARKRQGLSFKDVKIQNNASHVPEANKFRGAKTVLLPRKRQ